MDFFQQAETLRHPGKRHSLRGEYAVVAMAVSARLGDELGQSVEQLERGHPLAVLRQGHKAARWVQNAIQPYHMAIKGVSTSL